MIENTSKTLFPAFRPALIPATGSDQKYRAKAPFFGTDSGKSK
jgi:hypothetical protein